MEFELAKQKFVQTWGVLGTNWGINRTMAQIHALLLICENPLSADDVMQQLQISRGNANQNLRELIDWGLVAKSTKLGERKEYFAAEKDIWKVAKQIIKERRKREIEPIHNILNDLKKIKIDKANTEQKHFINMLNNIDTVVTKMDTSVERLIKLDENAIVHTLFKLLK